MSHDQAVGESTPDPAEGSGSVASILRRDRARSWSSLNGPLPPQLCAASQEATSRQNKSHVRKRSSRSRASSSASIPDHDIPDAPALASVMTANAAADRSRPRPSTSRRSSVRRPDQPRSNTANGAETLSSLSATRNRSSPHLPGLSRLSTYDHGYGFSPITTPSSPVISAALTSEHPWASFPTSPSGIAHSPFENGASSYFPPVSSPRPDELSEWAQQRARMHQAAQLLGLHRMFASRSTPHLPVLSPPAGQVADFDTPPPYAPQASAQEHELERGANVPAARAAPGSPTDPPLPPPITIPRGLTGPLPRSAGAGSSVRGSRSGPPSPSASFYGARGMSSISPLPPGLGMTPAMGSPAAPISPGATFGDSSDSDRDDALSFSSFRSRERRHDRRRSVEASISATRSSSVLPPSVVSSRSRSGSGASVRRLRPTSAVADPSAAAESNGASSVERHHSIGRCVPRDLTLLPSSDLSSPTSTPTPHPAIDRMEHDRSSSTSSHAVLTPTELDQLQRAVADLDPPAAAGPPNGAAQDDDDEFPLLLRVLLLHPLRLLAIVPGCVGTFWLARNGMLLLLEDGMFSSVSSRTLLGPSRRQPGALDFGVSCLWSVATAYHALSFTTLLLRRWLLYYSILPSIIRLVALQAICWPLVRLTVHMFGADQPLAAWVVIGTTTACSDIISRWVTSNIADAVLEDDEEYVDEFGQIRRDTPGSEWEGAARGRRLRAYADVRDEKRKGGQGTRFWRAVIGGPSRRRRRGAGTETEWESDYATDRSLPPGLRRRRGAAKEEEERTILPPPAPEKPAGRRREFHWDVAIRRNVLPVAALGYLSMWLLIVDGMHAR